MKIIEESNKNDFCRKKIAWNLALVNQPSAKFLKNQKTHLGAYDSGITAKHKIMRKPALSEIESILSIESHNSKNLSLVKR